MKPAATVAIKVSFDYCLVKIRRPWYIDSLIADSSWCVPTLRKGAVSANAKGTSLAAIPIGFAAVRNLSITAELANVAQADCFGPFKVEAGIVSSALAHPGMQIVGWLVQSPPPNDAPGATLRMTSLRRGSGR